MIPIVYFRSSSYNCHRMCEMQYYGSYVLGINGKSNKKADKGTISHKILEICAISKKLTQDGLDRYDDPDIGEVITNLYDPEYLNAIGERVYHFYTSQLTHHQWTVKDFDDCMNSVWKALKFGNGMFDPMNRNVVAPEAHFDIPIEKDWAKFNYEQYGIEGHLSLKGTVDLITDVGNGVYEVIDWKTGKRLDWATGKVKDQEGLFKDGQLRIYHYALKHLYPHVKAFIITIYFINDGGPYTVHFGDNDIEATEKMIQRRFEYIKNTDKPKLMRRYKPEDAWKCSKLCHLGQQTFENTHVEPIIEKRARQVTRYNQKMTMCEQILYSIETNGIDWTTKNYKHPNHTIGKYKKPGEVENDGSSDNKRNEEEGPKKS